MREGVGMQKVLEDRIRQRKARVGIVGLGYVGLPLAVEFANAGFPVTGIDLSESKVAKVNAGESYIADIPGGVFKPLVESGDHPHTSRPAATSSGR